MCRKARGFESPLPHQAGSSPSYACSIDQTGPHMPRRKTTIGIGAFGNRVPVEGHAWEVLQRILSRGHPLTEDAVFLSMYNILRQRGSRIFQKVRESSDVGGYRYFHFSPDIDLLEVRQDNTVVGYELKGERRRAKQIEPPMFYEGIDQGLAYLVNPTRSPSSSSFAGSIFDHVYVVHPDGSQVEKMADLLQRCTPLGLVVVSRERTTEIVKPKPNPYMSADLKSHFLSRLDAFETYTTYKINPIQ